MDVQDEAVRPAAMLGSEERLRRGEGLHTESRGIEETPESPQERVVVIDDTDHR
jgi:hypothetical protein